MMMGRMREGEPRASVKRLRLGMMVERERDQGIIIIVCYSVDLSCVEVSVERKNES